MTSRGVDRCAIVRDDHDRLSFVKLLRASGYRWRWKCHAYCLMGNHYHLIVETKLEQLSRGCHRLNGIHAQEFNSRHGRVGHLFQGRFESRVIRHEAHLAAACAYTWNNPVRASLCPEAGEWPWSGSF